MRIAVLASEKSWHFLDLKRAAKEIGIELLAVNFENLSAEVGKNSPITPLSSVDAILVRTMPPGSLQQIIFRMDVIGQIANRGTPVFNPPKSLEAAIDKYLSLEFLTQANVPVPKTLVSQRVEEAIIHFESLNRDVVVKPIFGSMGRGVQRLNSDENAASYFESCVESGEVIYQQEFIENEGFDIRLLVIGDQIHAMKRRSSSGWITNLNQGGIGEAYTPSDFEIELAIRAAKSVGAHIAGVDLIYRKQDGIPFVLEVNGSPGWKGISEVLQIDIAKQMLLEIKQQCRGAIP